MRRSLIYERFSLSWRNNSMAELVWKNKHHPDDQHKITAIPLLITHQQHHPQGESVDPLCTDQWRNRLILADRCDALLALQPEFSDSVNLIYIDPPFMTGRTFRSGREVAYKDTWHNNLDTYLQWLYETLILLYPLLAPDGSLYIHLDWRVTHYARVMLDDIFGGNAHADGAGFKNEIIWQYQSGGRPQKGYARKHDTILFYTKSEQYTFHGERISERRGTHRRNHMRKAIDEQGRISWTIRSAGRIYSYHEDTLMSPSDVWSDISHLHQKDPERTGYATQKPEALLERILLASSEENDLVLDCFCGSGVTPVVAERLGRRWIACDQSEMALRMTSERLLSSERKWPFSVQSLE
ncbi:MAG TPA: site-specific DNA-methyltransferase [Ktedonosporobacter sp.]|nr:site-specific DNA-methyltransferase [Ktedonosporobacter sp.]